MKSILLITFFLLSKNIVFAQSQRYSDPAVAYQWILLEKGSEGVVQQIGNYKVMGNSYLFGNTHEGDVYTPKEKAEGIKLSYNTYNQQVDVYQKGNELPIRLNVNEVDSFRMIIRDEGKDPSVLFFINGTIIEKSKKFFLQEVYAGERFSLYKAYSSSLGYASSNYVQPDLRQFNLTFNYYYKDSTREGLIKLKTTPKNLKSIFKNYVDISPIVDTEEFEDNLDYNLKEIFALLNSK